MCLCVAFIRRSLHFFGKSFLFIFLFLCYPYFGTIPLSVLCNGKWMAGYQIINWKQIHNLCLRTFTLSDLKIKIRTWTGIRRTSGFLAGLSTTWTILVLMLAHVRGPWFESRFRFEFFSWDLIMAEYVRRKMISVIWGELQIGNLLRIEQGENQRNDGWFEKTLMGKIRKALLKIIVPAKIYRE